MSMTHHMISVNNDFHFVLIISPSFATPLKVVWSVNIKKNIIMNSFAITFFFTNLYALSCMKEVIE